MNLQLSGLPSFTAKQTIFSHLRMSLYSTKLCLIDCSCSDQILVMSLESVSDNLSIYISIHLLGKLSHVLCRFYHTLNSVSQFYNMAPCLKLVAQTDNRVEPPSWVWCYIWILWIFCWIMSGWYSTFRIQDVRLVIFYAQEMESVVFQFSFFSSSFTWGLVLKDQFECLEHSLLQDFHGYWAF